MVQYEPVSKPGRWNGLKTLLLVARPPTTPGGALTSFKAQPTRISPPTGTLLLTARHFPSAAYVLCWAKIELDVERGLASGGEAGDHPTSERGAVLGRVFINLDEPGATVEVITEEARPKGEVSVGVRTGGGVAGQRRVLFAPAVRPDRTQSRGPVGSRSDRQAGVAVLAWRRRERTKCRQHSLSRGIVVFSEDAVNVLEFVPCPRRARPQPLA
jgi:hypothetical protein